jgi:hypothetical protein
MSVHQSAILLNKLLKGHVCIWQGRRVQFNQKYDFLYTDPHGIDYQASETGFYSEVLSVCNGVENTRMVLLSTDISFLFLLN